MKSTFTEIAVRSAAIWSIGIIAYAGLSAALAGNRRPLKGQRLVLVALSTVFSVGAILLGCYGAGVLLGMLLPSGGFVNGAIFAITFIGVLWASSILTQLARNAAYRMVGKEQMPIEWYYVRLPKPQRRKKRWKDEGFDLRKF